MAEGGVAPPPPKRPSVRPPPPRPLSAANAGSSVRIPARPAPPVPGGKPSSSLAVKAPEVTKNDAKENIQRRENGQSGSSAARKRPEITIVCARPMSQVGFRDQSAATNSQSKPSSQNASQSQSDPPVKSAPTPELPSRNLPAVPPRKDIEGVPQSSTRVISRPPPIPKTSPNVPPAKKLSPSVVPRAVPPSPSPRPAPRTENPPTGKSPTDRHPPVPLRTSEQTKETNSDKPPSASLPKPTAASPVTPEPLPRPRSSSGEVTHTNEVKSEDSSFLSLPVTAESATTQDNSVNKNLETIKPSRPTIIRVKKNNSVKAKVDSVNSKQGNNLNEDVSPNLQQSEREVSDIENNQKDEVLSTKSSAIEKIENKTLKSQEEDSSGSRSLKSGSILNSVKMFESQMQSESSSPVEPKKSFVKPPVTAPKPKPAVLPKPGKALISPASAESSDVVLPGKSPAESDADKETVENVNERSKDDSPKAEKPKVIELTSDESKQTVGEFEVKRSVPRPTRPTIIRGPPKPKRQISQEQSDNDDTPDVIFQNSKVEDSEQETSTVSGVRRRERTVDDTEIKSPGRPPPPLPSRRPASIAGVPQNFSLAEINLEEKSPSATKIATSETQVPNRPKPAGRTRPVSLHVSSDAPQAEQTSQVPTGRSGSSVLGRPPPPKPQSVESRNLQPRSEGPPPRPSPVARRSSSSDIKSKPSILPSGQLPQPADKTSGATDEDSNTERRPSRPKVGPIRPTSVPMKSRPEDRLENREPDKPPRPVSAAVKKPGLPRPPSPARPQSISSPPLPKRPGAGHPLYHYMLSVPHGVALHDFDGSHPDDLSFKAKDVVLLVKRVDGSWLRGKVGEKEGMFPQEFIQIVIPISDEPLPSTPASVSAPAASPWDDDLYCEEADNISETKPDLIGHGPRCQARFDFEGGGDGDLQFEDGDYIRLLERVDDEWMKGEINGNVGIFPLAFVEIIEDLPAEQSEMLLTSPESGYRSTSQENITDRHDTSSPPGGISSVPHDHTDEDVSDLPSVMALYDFEADAPGDLPLKFGDYVKVIGRVNDEWLYGQNNGKEGQFPVQFIDEVPENLPQYIPGSVTKPVSKQNTQTVTPTPSSSGDVTDEPYCIAVHDFSGQTADDLNFKEGEIIQLLGHIGDDWLKGRLRGTEGIFPSAFVRIEKDCTASPQTKHTYAEASFDFEGQSNDELSFKKGDRILLGEVVVGAQDWQWGEMNGHRGIFPVAFVTVIDS